ncbi:unnamed protein product, partial [Heterotrigona itama]
GILDNAIKNKYTPHVAIRRRKKIATIVGYKAFPPPSYSLYPFAADYYANFAATNIREYFRPVNLDEKGLTSRWRPQESVRATVSQPQKYNKGIANQAAMPMLRDASFARASGLHARSRPRLSSTGAVVHAGKQRHQATLRVGSQGGQGQEFLGVRECLAHIATSRSPETSQSFLEAVHQRPQGRSCSLKRTLSESLLGSFLLSCDCLSGDTILDR